jgi:diguanylate cyclase (GGDEF)-like protein
MMNSHAADVEQQAVTRGWLRHGHLGVALTVAAAVTIAVYSQSRPQDPDKLQVGCLAAATVATMAVLWWQLPRIVASRHRLAVFLGWSIATVAVILYFAAVDGGEYSPVVVLLALPILFAGLSYPPRAVFLVGTLTVGGYIVLGATDTTGGGDQNALFSVALVLVTMMSAEGARHRQLQQHDLQELAGQLQQEATHDGLTGCLNRRGFGHVLNAEVARANREHQSLAIAMIDVDRLKQINDRDGHVAGDFALRCVGQALRTSCRASDHSARIGGDEFAVVLPSADASAADALLRRIRSKLTMADGIPVTVSIGLACADGGTIDVEDMLRAADEAMYAAKAGGRDCVRTWVAPPTFPMHPVGAAAMTEKGPSTLEETTIVSRHLV